MLFIAVMTTIITSLWLSVFSCYHTPPTSWLIGFLVIDAWIEHAFEPLNLAQQASGNQWIGWRKVAALSEHTFLVHKWVWPQKLRTWPTHFRL